MITEMPNVKESGRYQLTEAARLMQCDRRTLLKYAAAFKQAPQLNPVSQRPYFRGRQLLRIWRAIM